MLKAILLLLSILKHSAFTQVYTSVQTRHRFAQINMGFDVERSIGGHTSFLGSANELRQNDLSTTYRPRLLIGGTHF